MEIAGVEAHTGFTMPTIPLDGDEIPFDQMRLYEGHICLQGRGDLLMIVEDAAPVASWDGYRGWLVQDGTVVGMIRAMKAPSYNQNRATVCDVEIREEYRGNGLSRFLYLGMQEYLGEELYTQGHYTPSGLERLQGKAVQAQGEDPRVLFSDQTFVADWDKFQPLYG